MTSKLTRERLHEIAEDGFLKHGESKELASIALAAMDSEPVGEVIERPCSGEMNTGMTYRLVKGLGKMESMPVGTKFYVAQPVPVAYSNFEEFWSACIHPLAQDDELKDFAWDIWNACRAAMLQELQKSAGAEAICRSDENVQVLHTKSPAQSDCCPAQNVAVPAQRPIDHGYLPECECSWCKATSRICTEMAVNSLVISNEMTAEQHMK